MPGLTNPQPTKKLKLGKECLNACYFGNTALLMKLVEKGGDTSHMDPRDGWSGIHYAARWGKIKMLEVLVNSGVDINMRTTGKETALHKACRSNRKEVHDALFVMLIIVLVHHSVIPLFFHFLLLLRFVFGCYDAGRIPVL